MNVKAVTKDKVVHSFVEGKWVPEITVPSHIHEKTLRNINECRKEMQHVTRNN